MSHVKPDPDFDRAAAPVMAAAENELRSFIERLEQLAAEKRDLADQEKEVMAEAKGRGYSTAMMREIIKLRKMKPDDVAEREAILDMYKHALGMWCGSPCRGPPQKPAPTGRRAISWARRGLQNHTGPHARKSAWRRA